MRDNSPMSKKKPRSDRHKPRRMAGIREPLLKPLEILAERLTTDFTELVNRAVRELLEKEGLWPPPQE